VSWRRLLGERPKHEITFIAAAVGSELSVEANPDGTWRVKDVPLVSTGIEYPISTGVVTFTEEMLADAVKAVDDPAIVAPRIKLGHASGYNAKLIDDAEPAFGRIDPSTMRLGDNDQTIYADYTGMPAWLASILPVAYPNRSIEARPDVKTVTGKSYQMVITAVSLLGVRWPGCSVLEDLPLWYGDNLPDGVELDANVSDQIAAATGEGTDYAKIAAAVDISSVRKKFYNDVATGDAFMWWIRSERYDDASGLQLIVDQEDGNLVRYPVMVNGSEVDFGEPVPVTEEYPNKIAASYIVAGMVAAEKSRGAVMTVHASRAETDTRPSKPIQGGTMDDETRKSLAKRVGLPEDATEEQIHARIDGLQASSTEGEGEEQPPPEGEESTEGEESSEEETEEEEAPATQAGVKTEDDGTVRLDKEAYEALKRGADAGLRLEAKTTADEDERILAAAIKAGKFPKSRKDHYKKLLDLDRDGTRQQIKALEAGLVPVEQRGSTAAPEGEDLEAAEGLPWFKGESERIRARQAGYAPGSRGRVTEAKEA
jgi:Mu-like prophage I protein